MFQKCQERIKHIGAGEALTPQELLIRQNIQATLAQQLQALSLEFRRHQKEYLQRTKCHTHTHTHTQTHHHHHHHHHNHTLPLLSVFLLASYFYKD
jgi:hypothetical protein